MARVAVTATTPTAIGSNGTNITDLAGSQTMVTGSGRYPDIETLLFLIEYSDNRL
jgi:hypothetical protein